MRSWHDDAPTVTFLFPVKEKGGMTSPNVQVVDVYGTLTMIVGLRRRGTSLYPVNQPKVFIISACTN